MKRLVVYKSGTGFTKQYAQWIAVDLGCEAKSIKEITKHEISQCDCLIYGGWILGDMIMGLNKIRKCQPKQLITFGVGAAPNEKGISEEIVRRNQLETIPFFYMVGGFRFEQLNFIKRIMLNTLKKSLDKKTEKTPKEACIAEFLGISFDHSDQGFTRELVAYVKAMK